MTRDLVERVWYSGDPAARAARTVLGPLGRVFELASRGRNALFDRGTFASHDLALPAVSVGNLTVGGTGKTPMAAEVARRLRASGASPAIVLRGYGDDEPLVHERLNPGVPVVVAPDRVAGARDAAARGATVAVLDDAFQHRRARRDADIVLVSADRWTGHAPRGLPAGPWREPLDSLRRASLVVVTRKAARDQAVDAAVRAVGAAAPRVPVAVVRLAPDELRLAAGAGDARAERRPVGDVAGRRVLLAAAIGDPSALVRQIESLGAEVDARIFGDHHAFTPDEVDRLVRDGGRADLVVCTLKDAVKLQPAWPRAGPALWYVSQSVTFERGEDEFDEVLRRLLPHRPPNP